jgi:thiol-disulfide isomerase/thioredoxin
MKILKIGADWCQGCLIMKPRFAEIEKQNTWLETEFYDYDEDKEVMEKYNISEELPCFIFLDKQGNEFLRLHGEIEKEKIIELINQHKDK